MRLALPSLSPRCLTYPNKRLEPESIHHRLHPGHRQTMASYSPIPSFPHPPSISGTLFGRSPLSSHPISSWELLNLSGVMSEVVKIAVRLVDDRVDRGDIGLR